MNTITRRYKKDNSKSETDFIPISMVGNNAVIANQLLEKGSPVLIWGNIQVRIYEKGNERKWITEIIADNFQVLEKKKKDTLLPQDSLIESKE